MSKYNFKDVNFGDGDNLFGDIYTSCSDFLNHHQNLSDTGKEVAENIFKHLRKSKDRQTLLNSLKKIDSNEVEHISSKEKGLWIKFRDKLIESGLEESAETVKVFLLQSGSYIAGQFAQYFQ